MEVEEGKMKFKILPKVHGFTDAQGIPHLPGEIVDLPISYLGETWLKPVEEKPKVVVPAAKLESAEPEPIAEPAAPLETKKKRKPKSS